MNTLIMTTLIVTHSNDSYHQQPVTDLTAEVAPTPKKPAKKPKKPKAKKDSIIQQPAPIIQTSQQSAVTTSQIQTHNSKVIQTR